jgi:hypothetical protein
LLVAGIDGDGGLGRNSDRATIAADEDTASLKRYSTGKPRFASSGKIGDAFLGHAQRHGGMQIDRLEVRFSQD